VFYVYVLQSKTTGKTYIGQTNDINKRLAEHNDQLNRFTLHTKRHSGPWELAYEEQYSTRAEAVVREKWLKSGSGRRFLKRIFADGC